MKVAMLTTTGDRCGIAAYSRELVRALAGLVDVTVEPIEVGRQPRERYVSQAERLNAADVVHVQHEHSFWGGILPGKSAFWEMRYLITQPFVITAHTTTSLAELLRLRTERRLVQRIAKEVLVRRRAYRQSVDTAPFATRGECIVHTEGGRDDLAARGVDPGHIHVIPAGVPPPAQAATGGASFRERHGIAGKRVISLFGYVTPNKGYELTLDALPRLPADVVFAVAGGPRTPAEEPYLDRLRERVTSAGLAGRVVFTGYLPDEELAEVMAASDLVVTPHTDATGSYSVMVALAYGKPVVASDLGCFREIGRRAPCVRLFPAGSTAAYAQCLQELLADPAALADLALGAAAYAAANSWDAAAARTVEVYRLAVEGARRGAHG